MCRFIPVVIATILSCFSPGLADAAVQFNSETVIYSGPLITGTYDPSSSFSQGPSDTDLLAGLAPTESVGNFTQELLPGLPALTDGSISLDVVLFGPEVLRDNSFASAGQSAGTSVTYSLGHFYDISTITVFGGWFDWGRDQLHFSISTSTDSGASFNLLTTHNGNNINDTIVPITHRVEFFNDSDHVLAYGVTDLRFDFHNVDNGWSGYQEIDVLGINTCGPHNVGCRSDVTFSDITDNFLSVPSTYGEDGDLNYDNFVDAKDFRLWKDYLGQSSTASDFLSTPEPSAIALLLVASVLLASSRRCV